MALCGLDFGTSNSTLAVLRDGAPTMVPLETDAQGVTHTTLPSAIFFGFEDTATDVGRRAVSRYTAGEPGRLMRSMKSVLGTGLMGEHTQVLGRSLSYDDIIGLFVTRLRAAGNRVFDGQAELDAVVMGRPVFFNDSDPARDRAAEEHLATIARLAGFTDVSFQYEPIAAALDYESRVQGEELAVIIDVGGGTSDFTLIRLSAARHTDVDRSADVLANHGVHIGGTDFDRNLSVHGVMPTFGRGVPLAQRPSMVMPSYYYFDLATWHRIHLLYERHIARELVQVQRDLSDKRPVDRLLDVLKHRRGHHLAALVEQAKIALSEHEQVAVPLDTLLPAGTEPVPPCDLTRPMLHEAIGDAVASVFAALDETLTRAGLTHDRVDTVFTTGGSTALPLIADCCQRAFPTARHVAGDLYTSVGTGLLAEARKRYR
ncbi:MAG: Hsp70 family protein [Pseudomonadota bacterium]